MKITDITIEKVKAAYEKTGIKSKRGKSQYEEGKIVACCALDVLREVGEYSISDGEVSFMRGFDGEPEPDFGSYESCNRPAYDLGKKIAEELGL